jgi:hypothetical protein
VAQITRAQRIERVDQLLKEASKQPPSERHEVVRLPWGGEAIHAQAIKIPVEEVLLNHRSHRVRAQLQDDPQWKALENDPYSEAAQRLIEQHVRNARTPQEFAALKDSLLREGQTDPGVITFDGVLVNANTRAVAMRDFEDPSKRWIRVAVLPQSASQQHELTLLELRLQMQKELKVDYSLTNELLFIEELSDRTFSDAQIARELRIWPENEKKGAAEVRLRLQMLDLIRDMQKIPAEHLPLTFFDTISYEHLRDLHRNYHALLKDNPPEARSYMESFLLSMACDVTPVHQMRKIDASFMAGYMLPQLEEDEVVGDFANKLVGGNGDSSAGGHGSVFLTDDGSEDGEALNVKQLIDLVTRRDKRVEVPGTPLTLERDDVKQAVKTAIITGIKDKRRVEREADKLEAPTESVKQATREITQAIEAVRSVANDPDFDAKRKKTLEAAHKKLKRTARDLEQLLVKSKIIPE